MGVFFESDYRIGELVAREVCEHFFEHTPKDIAISSYKYNAYCDCCYNSKKQFNFSLDKISFIRPNKKKGPRKEIFDNRFKISNGIKALIDNAFINKHWDDYYDPPEEEVLIPNVCIIINAIDYDGKRNRNVRIMYQYNCGKYYGDYRGKIMNDEMYKKIIWKHKHKIN